MAASLNHVDSTGVADGVVETMEAWRQWYENNAAASRAAASKYSLTFNMDADVEERDAEYICECLRVHEQAAKRTRLRLLDMSDAACNVFVQFLGGGGDTAAAAAAASYSYFLPALTLLALPSHQVRRLLAAFHGDSNNTNRLPSSVTELRFWSLDGEERASWIADLLRRKKDFTKFHFLYCRFPFQHILPLLREQSNLKSLELVYCNLGRDDDNNIIHLFDDPECTQLFVDNVLLPSPSLSSCNNSSSNNNNNFSLTTLKIVPCGGSMKNPVLMDGFHKNTTLLNCTINRPGFRRFLKRIMCRNRYLARVHEMLGTPWMPAPSQRIMTRGLPPPLPAAVSTIVPPPPQSPPPPCTSLWPVVLAKVGQCRAQGATPVFVILQDRLATWIVPSPRQHRPQLAEQQQQQNVDNGDAVSSCPAPEAVASSLQPPPTANRHMPQQLVAGKAKRGDCVGGAEEAADDDDGATALGQKKRAAPQSEDYDTTLAASSKKISKSSAHPSS